jgi:hypothetical protein
MSKGMKRIILSVMVLAFAVAVQAGDDKTCQDKDKDKPACCASHKTKVSTEANTEKGEGCCPFAKAACCKQTMAKQTTAKQPVLFSPKALDTAR